MRSRREFLQSLGGGFGAVALAGLSLIAACGGGGGATGPNGKLVADGDEARLPDLDGVPGRARGLNTVGLRRAGVDQAGFRALKEAYRLLYSSSVSLREALDQMSAIDSAAVGELKAFIEGSRRGFAHPRTKGA